MIGPWWHPDLVERRVIVSPFQCPLYSNCQSLSALVNIVISEHDAYLFNRNQGVHSLHVTGEQKIQGTYSKKSLQTQMRWCHSTPTGRLGWSRKQWNSSETEVPKIRRPLRSKSCSMIVQLGTMIGHFLRGRVRRIPEAVLLRTRIHEAEPDVTHPLVCSLGYQLLLPRFGGHGS